jgi:hypothetical protein
LIVLIVISLSCTFVRGLKKHRKEKERRRTISTIASLDDSTLALDQSLVDESGLVDDSEQVLSPFRAQDLSPSLSPLQNGNLNVDYDENVHDSASAEDSNTASPEDINDLIGNTNNQNKLISDGTMTKYAAGNNPDLREHEHGIELVRTPAKMRGTSDNNANSSGNNSSSINHTSLLQEGQHSHSDQGNARGYQPNRAVINQANRMLTNPIVDPKILIANQHNVSNQLSTQLSPYTSNRAPARTQEDSMRQQRDLAGLKTLNRTGSINRTGGFNRTASISTVSGSSGHNPTSHVPPVLDTSSTIPSIGVTTWCFAASICGAISVTCAKIGVGFAADAWHHNSRHNSEHTVGSPTLGGDGSYDSVGIGRGELNLDNEVYLAGNAESERRFLRNVMGAVEGGDDLSIAANLKEGGTGEGRNQSRNQSRNQEEQHFRVSVDIDHSEENSWLNEEQRQLSDLLGRSSDSENESERTTAAHSFDINSNLDTVTNDLLTDYIEEPLYTMLGSSGRADAVNPTESATAAMDSAALDKHRLDPIQNSNARVHKQKLTPIIFTATVLILLFAICSMSSTLILNVSVFYFGALIAIPVYFTTSLVTQTVFGLVFFQEYVYYRSGNYVGVGAGILLNLGGEAVS